MKSFLFSSEKDAKKKAEEIGCEGTHKHKEKFMPCESHKTFLKVTKKKELEELIDYDGTFSSSKIPILEPLVKGAACNLLFVGPPASTPINSTCFLS